MRHDAPGIHHEKPRRDCGRTRPDGGSDPRIRLARQERRRVLTPHIAPRTARANANRGEAPRNEVMDLTQLNTSIVTLPENTDRDVLLDYGNRIARAKEIIKEAAAVWEEKM